MSISKKKVVLTISLLASGRKETTKKCLDSLKPIMEQIPNELIIVDTGCNEEDHALLLEYTDQVIPFTWRQDFSKARNVGLKAANGEWFLYLDDDEWFVEVQEILNFFKSGNYKKYGHVTYIQRNYVDLDGKHYSDTWVSCMIRIDKDTHFASKIHEYLTPLCGACAGFHTILDHYIYKNDEERTKCFERNRVLLDEMIEEELDNMRWWVQLVQEFRSEHKDEEMLDIGRRGLEKFKDRTAYSDCIDIGTFYAGNALALVNMQRYEEAREDRLFALQTKDDVHYRYFTMRSAEAELLFKREWDYASCEGALRRFADLTMEFNRQYYRPQIFESYKVLLPSSVQAAYWIQRGFQEEDHAQCNKCLKQAVSVYNGLADIVKEYIRLYGKEQLEKERKAREARIEMRRLVKEIKGKVKQLIDDKMYAEAASVLEQLKTMCPNDLEVAGMGLRLRLGQLGATV